MAPYHISSTARGRYVYLQRSGTGLDGFGPTLGFRPSHLGERDACVNLVISLAKGDTQSNVQVWVVSLFRFLSRFGRWTGVVRPRVTVYVQDGRAGHRPGDRPPLGGMLPLLRRRDRGGKGLAGVEPRTLPGSWFAGVPIS